MASNYTLPPPPALEIHDPQAAEKWKRCKRAGTSYSLATGLNEKPEAVQVATLLTVVGEEAREVFSTFSHWERDGDDAKIAPVLLKFEQYCQPRRNVPFERYRFNRRAQESGETIDHIPHGTGLETHHVPLLRATQLRWRHACCEECTEFQAEVLVEREAVSAVCECFRENQVALRMGRKFRLSVHRKNGYLKQGKTLPN
jgi:hypothetical protein